MLISVLILGGILVYQEARAIPITCLYAELYCLSSCQGSFAIDYCWETGSTEYCYFWCSGYGHGCDWPDPLYSFCEGSMK
jgi:hypothetical protein